MKESVFDKGMPEHDYVWTIFDYDTGDSEYEADTSFETVEEAKADGLDFLKGLTDGHYVLKVWNFYEDEGPLEDGGVLWIESDHGEIKDDMDESVESHGQMLNEDEYLSNPFKVGDILAGSYNYRVIIPHFTQVIAVTPKSVKCRDLVGQGMSGMFGNTAYAEKDVFDTREPIWTARVKYYRDGDSPHVYHGQVSYSLWDGKPMQYDYMD